MGKAPITGPSFSVKLDAATSPDLRAQLPAVLLHRAFLETHGLRVWTQVEVEANGIARHAWLAAASDRTLTKTFPDRAWSNTAFLSADLADNLHIAAGDVAPVTIRTFAAHVRLQPARIDNYLQSHEALISNDLRDHLGLKNNSALLVSESGTVVVKLASRRRSRGQRAGMMRLNYDLRRLLGVDVGHQIQIGQFNPSDVFRRRQDSQVLQLLTDTARLPGAALELLARLALRAPQVTLSTEESSTGDDTHGVVRMSRESFDLLGIDGGDNVRISWGRFTVVARAHMFETNDSDGPEAREFVDWMRQIRAKRADEASRITMPAKLRVELGAPRNSIVVVRRSVTSRIKRRLIVLALPLTATAVAVPPLGLQLPQVAGITAGVLVLTMAGDRISKPRFRRI